jgi:hypothetical protein
MEGTMKDSIDFGGKTLFKQPDGTYATKRMKQLEETVEGNRAAVERHFKGEPAKAYDGPHGESLMQQDCVKWFRLQYKREVLFSVPNGAHIAGTTKKQIAMRRGFLEKEGLLKGVSDLILVCDKGVFFLEAKLKGNYQSQEQRLFQAMVDTEGRRSTNWQEIPQRHTSAKTSQQNR